MSKKVIFPLLLVLAIGALFAFKGDFKTQAETARAEWQAAAEAQGMEFYGDDWGSDDKFAIKPFTKDTLTNALKDTLTIPIALVSAYSYSVHLTLISLSGTRAMKVYLDESNTLATGTADWIAVDSITPTAPINQYLMKGQNVWGRRQRLRVSGNTGATQSQAYTITAAYKRTN